ncbi:signal transduction histidine kinase [Archangium gephyra]|uniref:histidine kinase n=1 Tax=Archangium gephyra TaxID=48 RepID=A0AAC8Q453_9BACT|nr:HAMP domain-containing sensor histidine kinase [Archangium gephyra]AKJ00038.1 Sensory box histidine kinase [Archangium gephyra]REG33257.1 signal transduction histidine kinase [Archangium gephyra]
MLSRHPTAALRAGVNLSAFTLLLVGYLLLAPGPLPAGGEEAGGLRVLVMATGFVGLAVGCALGWTLRQTFHPEEPDTSGPGSPLEALARENEHLRAEVRQALELVGVAAHDLGNPLLALQLRLQRLRAHTRENPRAQEGLALVEREARRMGLLVHDLLDLSRLSAGRLPLELEELDLAALAREVAERFSDQATAAGCALVVHAPGPVRGTWDRQRLDRVATNLLSNALKFGQGQPVELHVRAEGHRVRLAVKDHGVGLPPDAQGRLFGRFERLGATGRPGTGLGLYIVHQLVEAHGGTIHVSSRPGHGATFTIELPCLHSPS